MPDFFHTIMNFIDHERGKIVGVVLALLLGVGIQGCTPQTASLSTSGQTVTSEEFYIEMLDMEGDLMVARDRLSMEQEAFNRSIDIFNEKVATGQADLQRQMEFRTQVIDTIGGTIPGLLAGTVNPLNTIGSIVSLGVLGLGMGGSYDGYRKNKVIKKLKATPDVI